MSVSRAWVEKESNREAVLRLYRDPTLPTIEGIASQLSTTIHNVGWVVRKCLPEAERRALAALRYSVSKTGDKNPMKGKTGEEHPRWVGECEDGYGYLTCLWNGKRQFVHRVVMAQALGLAEIPEELDVHHIDSNPKNNKLDNLALVTRSGHRTIHSLQVQDPLSLQLKKSTLAEALRSMTSR